MMAKRISDAEWRGDLKEGAGTLKLGSGAFEGRYSFKSRFEDGPGTNPEELIAAAHAACFSMALSAALSQKGDAPTPIHTKLTVHFGPVTGGFAISRIELETEGQVLLGGAETAHRKTVADIVIKIFLVGEAVAIPAIARD